MAPHELVFIRWIHGSNWLTRHISHQRGRAIRVLGWACLIGLDRVPVKRFLSPEIPVS